MRTATLDRWCTSDSMGVFGTLRIGVRAWYTVEQPWRDNIPRTSCVPDGDYSLLWIRSPRFGRTVALENRDLRIFANVSAIQAPGDRAACLIHAANRSSELAGCIAPGASLGSVSGDWAVLQSRDATAAVLEALERERIDGLQIRTRGRIELVSTRTT